MAREALRVAMWRFEQISAFLDPHLTACEKRRLMEAAGKVCVQWPRGRIAPVPLSTLYRWLKRYRRDPRIESLIDPPPTPSAYRRPVIRPEWTQYALALLEEEPTRSLFVLTRRILDRFQLERIPSRSSLQRALAKEIRYRSLQRRARGHSRLRRRFQALAPHHIWHGDAKAPFKVTYADGSTRTVRILTLLDDATRFVLCALVVVSESLAAAVAAFRQAAARWGLPDNFYADRGCAYDSEVFRKGLAILGVHRINTRARNPSAHGKIEAYHRVLDRWFIQELRHQTVRDDHHLQQLLDALIDQLYHQHRHRELRQTPAQAFANQTSRRLVSLERLHEVFLREKTLTYHRKDKTVRVAGTLFGIPAGVQVTGRTVRIAIDPEQPDHPLLIGNPPTLLVPLLPAIQPAMSGHRPDGVLPAHVGQAQQAQPPGSLSPLLERYRGRSLPQARSGFGLPEIYQIFSHALGRTVPHTEREAAAVVAWLSSHGPFDPKALQAAVQKVLAILGPGRPLVQILESLSRKIRSASRKEESL